MYVYTKNQPGKITKKYKENWLQMISIHSYCRENSGGHIIFNFFNSVIGRYFKNMYTKERKETGKYTLTILIKIMYSFWYGIFTQNLVKYKNTKVG